MVGMASSVTLILFMSDSTDRAIDGKITNIRSSKCLPQSLLWKVGFHCNLFMFTSLGLDVLSQCSYQEWEDYLYIDIPVLNKMALWLVQQQNQTTGAFWETSMNFDHNMRSNLTNEYGQPMNMTLTSYAVVGLTRAAEKMFGAKAIHGTAFALEVFLMNNYLEESVPIMKWLQTQRFYEQGFHGTQDTLAAVRALTKFAERQTNREFYNMLVESVATSSPEWGTTFHMERGQIHGYETSSIPNVWGSIASAAEGSGYALLQMKTQVNVEYPQLMRQPQIRAFDLDIDYLRFSGRNASLFEMNICITWVATQFGERSGSVILEVDIPTGWFVRKQQLRIYQRVSRIESQRSRFTKQKVVLFMDYIDTNRTCWYFPAERHLPVANGSIQHMIRVQDSYEPGILDLVYELYYYASVLDH
ncbi:hypothetical protein LSH36_242g07003 [Paralvinella palmiformis]|uniref:Alpha-macroglobulin receptor-binding domain-containing protein n=1 Tax=Paralvinella palmiformis TaxID=53620 RepID=A0AAD9JLE3_9ANNE|nr:hypothetical protein LSH36_242g07003 [Paralvinella palmiformis]